MEGVFQPRDEQSKYVLHYVFILEKKNIWSRNTANEVVFEVKARPRDLPDTNNTDTNCQADAWLISFPAESFSGFIK